MLDYHSHPSAHSPTDILLFSTTRLLYIISYFKISFLLSSQFHFFNFFGSKNEFRTHFVVNICNLGINNTFIKFDRPQKMSILLIILGVILYITAVILFATNMTHLHYTSTFKRIIICVFSIPVITAPMMCNWKNSTTLWQMISAILTYVISITFLIIA